MFSEKNEDKCYFFIMILESLNNRVRNTFTILKLSPLYKSRFAYARIF